MMAGGPIQPIISGGDSTGANYFQITKLTTRNIRYRIRQSSSNVISLVTSGAPVIDDTWHDIRFERTGNTYYAYFDGTLQGEADWIGTSTNLDSWRLGSNVPENSSNFFEGYIDELLFTFNSDSNQNGASFVPSEVPYDTSAPFYTLDDGTIAPAVNVGGGNTAGSYWTKNGEGRLKYTVNDLNRFIIPEQGAGLAANSMRSFIVEGSNQAVGNEASAVNCGTSGFWAIDCDTSGTGADAGIGDDFQVLGSTYLAETLTASSSITEGTATTTNLTVITNSKLGTVISGTWNGTAIGTQYGGTGQNFSSSDGLIFLDSGVASAIATSALGLVTIGGAFHDGFSDYVANEHIDWTLSTQGTIHATNYVDNNTTYTGGTNLTLDGTTFDVDDSFLINNGDDTTTGNLTALSYIASSLTATSTLGVVYIATSTPDNPGSVVLFVGGGLIVDDGKTGTTTVSIGDIGNPACMPWRRSDAEGWRYVHMTGSGFVISDTSCE